MQELVGPLCERIRDLAGRLRGRTGLVQVMEVCGTHTMSVARSGLRSLLPKGLRLVSGPGCPVCVTDQSYIDQAVWLARNCPDVTVASYGDMVPVPGRLGSLIEARSCGASVEVVYSADQAVELALQRPGRQVVFLAVGFETTAPGTALAVARAGREGIGNFSVLTAHKRIVPAMEALLASPDVRIDGFLCPGHVSVIEGWRSYEGLVARHGRPCVVAGFDPVQILLGLAEILGQIAEARPAACSVYPAAAADGNRRAQELMREVFTVTDARWRALGVIPGSGLSLREEFASFDAARRTALPEMPAHEAPLCRCGDVITGRCTPMECGLLVSGRCTPRSPVGPCMVSSEGACAAVYKYELAPGVRRT